MELPNGTGNPLRALLLISQTSEVEKNSLPTLLIVFKTETQLEGLAWTDWLITVPAGLGPVALKTQHNGKEEANQIPPVEHLLGPGLAGHPKA